MLCKQLVRDTTNEDCRKVIDSLPGDPALMDMVTACSKVGSVEHKMPALAAVLRPPQKCFACGQPGHLKANCKQKQAGQKQKGTGSAGVFSCNRCGKPGHYAKQCKSKSHANGQFLGNLGNGKKSAKGKGSQTRVIPQGMLPNWGMLPMQAYSVNSAGAQKEPLACMFPPPQQ